MVAILDEDRNSISDETFVDLVYLTYAVRISYTLRDIKEDINSGICNIPEEDLKIFEIDLQEVQEFARSKKPLCDAPL